MLCNVNFCYTMLKKFQLNHELHRVAIVEIYNYVVMES